MFGPASGFDAVGEGTLFINAVSKMPVQVQTRLLKRLDQDFDGRLIAACGNDLEGLIEQGSFNSELFYRLARIEIPIPPARHSPRGCRLAAAAAFFASWRLAMHRGWSASVRFAKRPCASHDWPGGGRDLRARLLRGLAMATGPLLQPSDLFPERLAGPDEMMSLAQAREAAEKAQIIAALDRTDGQIGEAAKLLRIARTTLWEKMQKTWAVGILIDPVACVRISEHRIFQFKIMG